MFENIIGQDATVRNLRQDIEQGRLPHSILFHGPRYSGKLSAALELARALMDPVSGAPWNSSSRSSVLHRHLLHTNLCLLGSRAFVQEIQICADTLRRHQSRATRFLFIRSLRKLTRRFDTHLHEESALQKLSRHFETLSEVMAELDPDQNIMRSDEELQSVTANAVPAASALSAALGSDSVPVSMVRRAITWSHLTSGDAPKVIIIENADRMHDSSRNALLKSLEEPPPNAYFILLAERRSALLPTITSRLRPYVFIQRSREQERYIIARIFRDEETRHSSLREYFFVNSRPDSKDIPELAEQFLERVLTGEGIRDLGFDIIHNDEDLRFFGRELVDILRAVLRRERDEASHGTIELSDIELWTGEVEEHLHRALTLHVTYRNALTSLYEHMRHTG